MQGSLILATLLLVPTLVVAKPKAKETKASVPAPVVTAAAPVETETEAEIPATVRSQSELMHQAEAGSFELTPLFGIANTHIEYKTNAYVKSADQAGLFIGAQAEYGFSEALSLGLSLTYNDFRQTYAKKDNVSIDDAYRRGLSDPDVYLMGRTRAGDGWFRYGAHLTTTVEKSKWDGKTANAASGGTTLAPFVGFETHAGPGIAGGKIAYDVYKSDRDYEDSSSNPTVTSKIKGGERLALTGFYEWTIAPIIDLGFSLQYLDWAQTKRETSGVTVTNDDRSSRLNLEVYAPLHLKNQITLVPFLGFGTFTKLPSQAGAIAEVDSARVFQTGVFARFVF